MAVPKSVMRFKKDGVEFTSSVNHAEYLLSELIRAALKDTGKYIVSETRKRIHRRTGRGAANIGYWVRKRENDLQVGIKGGGFYLGYQEVGTSKIPKVAALTRATEENIDTIRTIQAQYLTALNDEIQAESMIDEGEYSDEIEPPEFFS